MPRRRLDCPTGRMLRPAILCFALLVALGAFRSQSHAAAPPTAARPNIVIVLADDLGYGDLRCYGHPTIHSPNLDRFATEGLRLTACYAAAPVCSPSRYGLMTGRTPYRGGIHNWIPLGSPMHMHEGEITIATLLHRIGYATCHVGKWHLNGKFNSDEQPQPSDHGFDYWFSTQNNALPSHRNPTNFVRNGKPVGKLIGYSAQLVTDEAIHWLRQVRPKDRPFFMFVCYHEPHEPIETDPRFSRLYPDTGKRSPYDPNTSSLAAHHGNITQMDYAFGRLMKTLDEDGLRDSTLVVFTSDNGPAITRAHPHGSAGPLREKKGHVYEGGIRVPGMVRWPGHVPAGTTSDTPVSGVDWLPTICGIVGIAPPRDRRLDGTDLRPLFDGKELHRTTPLYWQYDMARSDPKVAMRIGPWKLLATLRGYPFRPGGNVLAEVQHAIKTVQLDRFELYNLAHDMGEQSEQSQQDPDRFRRMRRTLAAMYHEVQSESLIWPAWTWPQRESRQIREYIEQRRREARAKQRKGR